MNATAKEAVLGELVCAAMANPPPSLIGEVTMRQALEPHRAMFVDAYKVMKALGDPEENADRMIEIADQEADGFLNWAIASPKLARSDPEADKLAEVLLTKWKLRRPGR
jgi:hypothetical protein